MRLTLFVFILFGSLAAEPGEALFDNHCAKCHVREISKAETLRKLGTLKAPPMIEVSNRLKSHIMIKGGDEDVHRGVVIAFIKHYIEYPDIMIGMCNPGAMERFGEMPSLKGKLSDTEKQVVAEWVYDYFENKRFE
jgi:mono/diheme cytochrome c family protein